MTLGKFMGVAQASIGKVNGVAAASIGKIIGIDFAPPVPSTFSFDVTTAAADTFELPILAGGAGMTQDFEVDWGDSSSSTITSYDDADRTHSYTGAGTFTVVMTGTCEWFKFNNAGDKTLIVELNAFTGDMGFKVLNFNGCTSLHTACALGTMASLINATEMFYSCSALTSIPSGLFDGCSGMAAANGFSWTFYACTTITSIPADLFRYQPQLTTVAFSSTFRYCIALTSIVADLFKYNINITTTAFSDCFNACEALTAIVGSLFDYNTAMTKTSFRNTFKDCKNTSLTSIPTDLFKFNTNITTSAFGSTFINCNKITTIPTDLFRYNISISSASFSSVFKGCSVLTAIPNNSFTYNTSAASFISSFDTCPLLETIGVDLFRYNTSCLTFSSTFSGSNKLQHHSTVFCASGEEGSRFLNQSVAFNFCFFRTSFTGTQGTAPALWDFDFGTGSQVTSNCFSGAGNDGTSLDNYTAIPTRLLTINVAPTTDWAKTDIITGQTSTETCNIMSAYPHDSDLKYWTDTETGSYTDAEVIGVTGNADKLADQNAGAPTFAAAWQ